MPPPQLPPAPPSTRPRRGSDAGLWITFSVLAITLVGTLIGFGLLGPAPAPAKPPAVGPSSGPTTPSASPTPTRPAVTDPGDAPLYRAELNVVSCPAFKMRKDVPQAELKAYLQTVLDCLVASNQEGFNRAGMKLEKPKLEHDVSKSPCSSREDEPQDWAGLYCSTNQTIYYHAEWKDPTGLEYLVVMSHEFAHHLQETSGILRVAFEQEIRYEQEPNGLPKSQQVSRRVELQAQCMMGATLGGSWSPFKVNKDEFEDVVRSYSSVPGEWAATHGTGRAQSRWITTGGQAPTPTSYKACNTFTAPADQVD